jgi:hypothetical protein
MTDNRDRDPRHGRDDGHDYDAELGRPADGIRHPDLGRRAAPAAGRPSEALRDLSEAEERDLHFNGNPPYGMLPLHELCYQGFCRYKSEAENRADLEGWHAWATMAAEADPEAEP